MEDDARRAPGGAAWGGLLRGVTADEVNEVARGVLGLGRLAEPLHYETDEVRLSFRHFPAARVELLIRSRCGVAGSGAAVQGTE